MRRVPEEEIDRAIDLYLNGGLTIDQASRSIGCSEGPIRAALKRRCIPLRRSRRYNLNEHFFDEIDNETKAYWLGFFLADGWISGSTFSVQLAERDKEHVLKYRAAISSEHPLLRCKTTLRTGTYYAYRLRISSVVVVPALARLGILPAKSELATVSCLDYYIPAPLHRHFWRGLFDGDGSIENNRTRNTTEASLIGTENVCRAFSAACEDHLNVPSRPYLDNQVDADYVWRVKITRRQDVYAVIRWLYEDSEVSLDRKMSRASLFMKAYESSDEVPRARYLKDEVVLAVREAFNRGLTNQELAVKFGIRREIIYGVTSGRRYRGVKKKKETATND